MERVGRKHESKKNNFNNYNYVYVAFRSKCCQPQGS